MAKKEREKLKIQQAKIDKLSPQKIKMLFRRLWKNALMGRRLTM